METVFSEFLLLCKFGFFLLPYDFNSNLTEYKIFLSAFLVLRRNLTLAYFFFPFVGDFSFYPKECCFNFEVL